VQPLKDVRGNRRIVLNVWATWCPPCLKELPSLDELGRSERAVVVTIVTDNDAGKVKDFLRNQPWGNGMLVWHDPDGRVTRAQMGAAAIPVSYILDSDLVVRRVEAGERDWASVRMIEVIEQATSE
jgi:thiol-disulfide isomerase/thioredoxin